MNTKPKFCETRKGYIDETLFCNCGESATYEAKRKPNSIFIEVIYWFDKSGGNTYWASTVYFDGVAVFETPFAYGHGETNIKHWVKERLHDYGVITCEESKIPLWFVCQENGVALYFSSKEANKKELKALGVTYGSLDQYRLERKGN